MELLYVNEHISCLNYEHGNDPVIEIISVSEGNLWELYTRETKIIFITEGIIEITLGEIANKVITQGKIILIPSWAKLKIKAKESTSLTIFRLGMQAHLYDGYSLEQFLKEEDINKVQKKDYLNINSTLWDYIKMLNSCLALDQFKSSDYFKIKLKELFFLLRVYYTKRELISFFYPLLTKDTQFSDFILCNYHKTHTVSDLAKLTHYSISGFGKRFKRVFGIPPHKWLKQQKAKSIYHEINCSIKTFKEISLEYDFTSPAHLNDFCKANFGDTPGNIRRKHMVAR